MIGKHPCESCGTEIASGLLTCPACHRLVHATRLKELAAQAEAAEQSGDPRAALVSWREALELLPNASRQSQVISERISELGRAAEAMRSTTSQVAPVGAESGSKWGQAGLTGLGAIGLAIWKFKFAAVFLLTKAKFLLLGLTKASTLLSMFATVAIYWRIFGWWFALGIVISIYIHEMGHVYVLNRYGVRASARMFIPGFGALIRLQQNVADVRQDARMGLAGPIWGAGAALCALGLSLAFQSPVLAAIARLGAYINLFNLIPIGSLDGGRAFRALNRSQRWLATAALGTSWALTEEPLLIIVIIAAVFRTVSDRGPSAPDRSVLIQYAGLVAVLSALMMIPVKV